MDCLNHWIPAFAGMTAGVDSSLLRAAPGILGGLFQTPLYRLHSCRRALSPHTGLPRRPVPDAALPIHAGVSINDGEVRMKAIRLPVCVYHFVVIPAKARLQDVGGRAASGTGRRGIQESDDEVLQATLIHSELPYFGSTYKTRLWSTSLKPCCSTTSLRRRSISAL